MTNEAMRGAIAEACGYRFPCPLCYKNGYKNRWRNIADTGCLSDWELPDYCGDLNAITSARNELLGDGTTSESQDLWLAYDAALLVAVKWRPGTSQIAAKHRATAHNHCTALLRTIGKYQS